jgi:peptide/nickel transport system permease protein
MASYIVRRLAQAVPLMVGITFLTFGIMHLAPGNPLAMMINPHFSPLQIERAEAALGLNQPVPVQYWHWLVNVLEGNLGYSIADGQPVVQILEQRLPATVLLTGTALAASFLIAIPLGILSAVRHYSLLDHVLTFLSFVGVSIPSFFFGLLLIYLFALRFGVLPASGIDTIGANYTGLAALGDVASHLVLPAATLCLANVALVLRHTRSAMLEVLPHDFVRTARAKGAAPARVVVRHALRNALIPVITLLGLALPNLVGGSFVIETVFDWPGIGQLGYTSIFARDYPVLMGLALLTGTAVLAGNLMADVLYALANPQIRYT